MAGQGNGSLNRPTMSVGMKLTGQKGVYTVLRPVSVSDRSMTYLCEDGTQKQYIVKYYNGSTTMRGEVRTAFTAMPPLPRILYPTDEGTAEGFPFDIIPQAGIPLDQANLTIQDILQAVIPQIFYIVAVMHSRRFLIRDIRPECFRYAESAKACALASFSDLALLTGNATATRAQSFGTDDRYCAPETARGEYSIYTDYYAVGVMLFHLLKGTVVFNQIQPAEFRAWKQSGKLPGSDDSYLRSAPMQAMTDTQKIQYLIMGLTNPDPVQRWTYPEFRVWNNGYHIPLVQHTTPRIRYQMDHPVQVAGLPYWDYDKLAQAMAENGHLKETEQIPAELLKRFPSATLLKSVVNDSGLSAQAKLFRCIYILHPATTRLYWRGRSYQNSAELARKAAQSRDDFKALQEMLKNRCVSFMLEQQKTKDTKALEEIRKLENLENTSSGDGANRFIQQMAGKGNTVLIVRNTSYPSFSAFIRGVASDPARLEKESAAILNDQGFKAYVWAKGGAAQLQAVSDVGPDQAFWTLMLLLETMADDQDKRIVRAAWISRTNYAPILHLMSHLSSYEVLEPSHTAVSAIRTLRISSNASLKELADQLPGALHVYQDFIRLCMNNVLAYELGIPEQQQPVFRPRHAEYAFSAQWNGIEVSRAFLWQSGNPESSAQNWINACAQEVEDWLRNEESDNQSVDQSISVDPVAARDFFKKNMGWAIAYISFDVILGLAVCSQYYRIDVFGILMVAGLCLPFISLFFFWRYRYNVARSISRTWSAALQSRDWFDTQRRTLEEESQAIVLAMQARRPYELRVVSEEKPTVTAHGQKGIPSRDLKIFIYVFTYIACFVGTVMAGLFYSSLRYRIGDPAFLLRAAGFAAILFVLTIMLVTFIQKKLRTSGIFWIVHLSMLAAFLIMSVSGMDFLKNTAIVIVGGAIAVGAFMLFFG